MPERDAPPEQHIQEYFGLSIHKKGSKGWDDMSTEVWSLTIVRHDQYVRYGIEYSYAL